METIYKRYRNRTTSFENTLSLIHDILSERLNPGIRKVWVQGSNAGRTNLVFTIFEDGRDYRMEFLTFPSFRQFKVDGVPETEERLINELIDRLRKGILSEVIY